MKLNATVTGLYSANKYTDGKQRVQVHVEGGDTGYKSFIVPNDGLKLDDEVVLLVLTKDEAAEIAAAIDSINYPTGAPYPMASLADQLRPDEPPPWESGSRNCPYCKHSDPLDEKGRCTHAYVGQSDNIDIDICGHLCASQPTQAQAETQP